MKILAHRGYWNASIEKNSPKAIRMALDNGYGFESDIRDYDGDLVISHNIADSTCQKAKEVFQWLRDFRDIYAFAINIKADGLKYLLMDLIAQYKISNYFLFDMSIPQMIEFKEIGLRFFTRQSEVELHPTMYENACGVWLDSFWRTDWITEDLLKKYLNDGKEICLVSPELHGRYDYKKLWSKIKSFDISMDNIMLCTDYPDQAKEYFNE